MAAEHRSTTMCRGFSCCNNTDGLSGAARSIRAAVEFSQHALPVLAEIAAIALGGVWLAFALQPVPQHQIESRSVQLVFRREVITSSLFGPVGRVMARHVRPRFA